MQPPVDGIRGIFKIDSLPDLACKEINSFADLIRALPQFAVVELPASFNSTIVGAQAPTADDTDKIWYRFDLSANFIGIYAFQNGSWQLIVQPDPGGVTIRFMYFNSSLTNNGWTPITLVGPTIVDALTRTGLVAQYIWGDVGHTFYSWSAWVFTGYT